MSQPPQLAVQQLLSEIEIADHGPIRIGVSVPLAGVYGGHRAGIEVLDAEPSQFGGGNDSMEPDPSHTEVS